MCLHVFIQVLISSHVQKPYRPPSFLPGHRLLVALVTCATVLHLNGTVIDGTGANMNHTQPMTVTRIIHSDAVRPLGLSVLAACTWSTHAKK